MTLERFYNLSAYALLLTAFVALVSTRQLDPLSVGLYSFALVLSWLID